MTLDGRIAVITGGAQGIGMATANAFAQAGAQVIIVDIDGEAAREHADTLRARNLRATPITADVADENAVTDCFAGLARDPGAVHVLINNAGFGSFWSITERETADWDRTLAVNLRGPYLCAKHAIPLMPPGGAIVNIASTRALMSEPNMEPYAASKGGLLALTHSLAISLADRRIRVNAVCPGWIDVSNWKKTHARAQAELRDVDHAQHPAKRVGRPEDVAEACLYLADTARAGFITGTHLTVDGGMTVKMIYEE